MLVRRSVFTATDTLSTRQHQNQDGRVGGQPRASFETRYPGIGLGEYNSGDANATAELVRRPVCTAVHEKLPNQDGQAGDYFANVEIKIKIQPEVCRKHSNIWIEAKGRAPKILSGCVWVKVHAISDLARTSTAMEISRDTAQFRSIRHGL
jgi:hypothetical protein